MGCEGRGGSPPDESQSLLSTAKSGVVSVPSESSQRRSMRKEKEDAVRLAIAEVARERAQARRRTRSCVQWTYMCSRVLGVLTFLLVGGMQAWVLGWGHFHDIQELIERAYLLVFATAACLAELETPFARQNFRALQKWWCKSPFYVFLGFLNMQRRAEDGTIPSSPYMFPGQSELELACLIILASLALIAVILHGFMRKVLEQTVFKKKKTRRRKGRNGKGRKLPQSSGSRNGGYGGLAAAHAMRSSSLEGRPGAADRPAVLKQDSVKWWVEDFETDSGSAASSLQERSPFYGSRGGDVEDNMSDITSLSGYRSNLRPVAESEEVMHDERVESIGYPRASLHHGGKERPALVSPSTRALEQRPPPMSPVAPEASASDEIESEGGGAGDGGGGGGGFSLPSRRGSLDERRPPVNFYNPF